MQGIRASAKAEALKSSAPCICTRFAAFAQKTAALANAAVKQSYFIQGL